MKQSHIVLTFALALMVGAIGLLIYGQTLVPKPRFTGKLRDFLPPAPPGWTVVEKPIAETPEMKKAVGELLNYDDGIYVDYQNSVGDVFSVYLAHWNPGKMSARLVAGHTPDVCWVGNGWRMVDRNLAFTPATGTSEILPPAQWGIYELRGAVQHVLFWHSHAGKIVKMDTSTAPTWWTPLADMASRGLNQRGEQFFMRLSSNQPVERWTTWKVYQELISALAPKLNPP